MKKLTDLESKELNQERDKIETSGESLGIDTYEAGKGRVISRDTDIYGLCKDCRYFKYVRYEFIGQRALCDRFDTRLSGSQRIVECNEFDERGKMSLQQMMDIAYDLSYLVEPDIRRAGLI